MAESKTVAVVPLNRTNYATWKIVQDGTGKPVSTQDVCKQAGSQAEVILYETERRKLSAGTPQVNDRDLRRAVCNL